MPTALPSSPLPPPPPPPPPGLPSPTAASHSPAFQRQSIQMETNGSSSKSQEIGSKRKWEPTAHFTTPLSPSNQHGSPLVGSTAKHDAYHSSGYQGHSSQKWPPFNNGRITDRQKNYREHKIICTICSKIGHRSVRCCQQNKSENRACTRCGEIGHYPSTRGLCCSSCDNYHMHGKCRLSEVTCFLCGSRDHYLAQCPFNSVLNAAFQDQRDNFQAALRLAVPKQGNTLSTPADCSAKSEVRLPSSAIKSAEKKPVSSDGCFNHLPNHSPSKGKVLMTTNSSKTKKQGKNRICCTCREEGHIADMCPQKFGAISVNMSKEVEESSTITISSDLSRALKEQDSGTAKQSSKTQGKKRICFTCREEGHIASMCPQKFGAISGNMSKEVLEESSTIAISSDLSKALKEQDSGTDKQSSKTKWKRGACFNCREEGHHAIKCPQKR